MSVQMPAAGKSNKHFALPLSVSAESAETHRAAVMRQLGVNSVVELVHYDIRNRLVRA